LRLDLDDKGPRTAARRQPPKRLQDGVNFFSGQVKSHGDTHGSGGATIGGLIWASI
jgi:hypothetical protein